MNEAPKKPTPTEISTGDLRKSLGEIFDQVRFTKTTFLVMRTGRQIGAIVPPELLAKLSPLDERRQEALQRLVEMLDSKPDLVADEEAAMNLANEAVAEVRS